VYRAELLLDGADVQDLPAGLPVTAYPNGVDERT
jgi:hypothetical protein